MDSTSRVHGNILQYDSSISKFKSVPMPAGSGGGSTTLGGLIDVDMTTVPPRDGNVLKFQGGKWKPSAEIVASDIGSSSYLIELNRWGIKQGLPTKPYVGANYIDADANIQGINNALKYAYDNGFSEVVLPRGKYALCFPKEIIMQSYLTFNLNGSTLKVIYDSDKKSPLDTRTTDDYYNFKGNTIVFSKTKFSHLINGIIIGCRDDRSFANPSEVAMEHSYGVLFEKGASYNSVTNCIVRDYMGDNVSVSSNGTFAYGEFDQGLELQGLNYTTGQPTTSTNTVTTRLLDIPQDLTPKVDCMLISGVGYARMTNLNSKDLDIFFYDKNNAFIGVMKSRRIYTEMSVPVNATKFRLQFLNETSASKTMQITIMFGGLPHHNNIAYNEIFNGHRGGVTLGGNYNTVEHNVIRDNGKGSVRFLDGKPIFNDPTRYSINMEDSYGANCVIRDNQFYGSYHGILVGCYSVILEDNYFYNIDYIAINLYSMVQANIRGNYFHNCMNNLGLMSSNFSSANVTVTDNTFVGGSMSLDNSAYRVMLSENHYHNPTFIALGDNCSFVNNYVIYTTTLPTVPIFTIKKAVGCTFKAMSESTEITFKSYRFDGCTFEKLTLRAEPINTKNREDTVFNDCDIISCSFRNHIFSGAPVKVTISDSKVTDTTFEAGITNTDNQNPYVSLEDCNIKVTTKDKLFLSDTNRTYATFRAIRCEVEIANPSFAYLLYSSGSKVNYVYLKDCNFAYTGAVTPLALKYYVNKSHIKEFISTGNRFDNITLPVADVSVYKGYDPEYSDVAEPSYGYYSLGKIIYNATPTAGGILGWVCIQEGVVTSVNWTASTAYVKGDLVLSGGKAYECVLGGTSSTIAPTQTIGQVKEGTVTWKYVGTKAIFKNFGLISN
ncbi:right-handed parallel beta-helix repeat-containing protein [Bacillus cereus]|uniref:right-handed parallel beta-helix repeat-containing protein n=1 Tax=Bacillus cereus TaxID=1396 RepID=UPI00211EC262|nr:right-handed parallel beta-helix repeat-containing protein [Bacillus cereus]